MLQVLVKTWNISGDLKNALLELSTCPEFCSWVRSGIAGEVVLFGFACLLVCSKKKQEFCWVMWLHLQLSLTWQFGRGFNIFRHTSVECCFRATPLLPCKAGRSCGAPAEISVLHFPLLCMLQGAIMQNADANPACWPNWDSPYLVLHAPHALLWAWCHELWRGRRQGIAIGWTL